jgi:hypothetical protein
VFSFSVLFGHSKWSVQGRFGKVTFELLKAVRDWNMWIVLQAEGEASAKVLWYECAFEKIARRL